MGGFKSNYYRINWIFEMVFVLGLVVMPFVWWNQAVIAYEIPRVWFVMRWIEILVGMGILRVWLDNKFKFGVDKNLIKVLLLFLAVLVLSAVFGVDVKKSFVGNYWRWDGIFTYTHLMALAVMVGVWWNTELKKKTDLAIYISVVGMGLWSLYEFVQNRIPNGLAFGQANFFVGWLLVSVVWVLQNFKNTWIKISAFVLGVIGLFVSGAVVGLPLLGLYLILKYPKLRVWGIGAIIILGIWWWKRFENYSWLGPNGVVYESRERIFRKVIGGTLERPLLGYGWANVDYAFKAYDWPFFVSEDVYVDKAHSSLVEVFATTGLIGLIAYLLLLGKVGLKLRNTSMLLVLIIYFIHAQTNVLGIAEEVLFWMVIGISLVKGRIAKD